MSMYERMQCNPLSGSQEDSLPDSSGFIRIQEVPVFVDGLNADVLSISSPTCGI